MKLCFHTVVANILLKRLHLPMILAVVGMTACASPPVTPPDYKPTAPRRMPAHRVLPAIDYTIQVGAFSSAQRAARYALRMQADGLDAYYFIDADRLYKVRFERFPSKTSARQRAEDLQADGRITQFYIVQPSSTDHGIDARDALQDRIVETARRFIGTSYRWGGASSRRGFDCSGLTMTVYRLNGLQLPRNSRNQYQTGSRISRKDLQKGDLVFFDTRGGGRVSHVGLYTGQGNFIHAPGKGKRIRIASLANGYFSSRYMGARRYF